MECDSGHSLGDSTGEPRRAPLAAVDASLNHDCPTASVKMVGVKRPAEAGPEEQGGDGAAKRQAPLSATPQHATAAATPLLLQLAPTPAQQPQHQQHQAPIVLMMPPAQGWPAPGEQAGGGAQHGAAAAAGGPQPVAQAHPGPGGGIVLHFQAPNSGTNAWQQPTAGAAPPQLGGPAPAAAAAAAPSDPAQPAPALRPPAQAPSHQPVAPQQPALPDSLIYEEPFDDEWGGTIRSTVTVTKRLPLPPGPIRAANPALRPGCVAKFVPALVYAADGRTLLEEGLLCELHAAQGKSNKITLTKLRGAYVGHVCTGVRILEGGGVGLRMVIDPSEAVGGRFKASPSPAARARPKPPSQQRASKQQGQAHAHGSGGHAVPGVDGGGAQPAAYALDGGALQGHGGELGAAGGSFTAMLGADAAQPSAQQAGVQPGAELDPYVWHAQTITVTSERLVRTERLPQRILEAGLQIATRRRVNEPVTVLVYDADGATALATAQCDVKRLPPSASKVQLARLPNMAASQQISAIRALQGGGFGLRLRFPEGSVAPGPPGASFAAAPPFPGVLHVSQPPSSAPVWHPAPYAAGPAAGVLPQGLHGGGEAAQQQDCGYQGAQLQEGGSRDAPEQRRDPTAAFIAALTEAAGGLTGDNRSAAMSAVALLQDLEGQAEQE